MSKKTNNPNEPALFVVTHYTSGSPRGRDKAIVQEKVLPGSETARFFERMEARRKTRPCPTPIDLRGHVPGECKAFFFGKLTHYLDEQALKTFYAGLGKNKGVFTIETYESIVSHPRIRAQLRTTPEAAVKPTQNHPVTIPGATVTEPSTTEQSAPDIDAYLRRLAPPTISFGYFRKRKEPRLLYQTGVRLLFGAESFEGVTIDLSVGGALIQIDEKRCDLQPGDTVTLAFDELASKYPGINFGDVRYVVLLGSSAGETIKIALQRADDSNLGFSSFLAEFIQSHSQLYKIDTADDVSTLRSQIYQRIYSQSYPGMPLFFRLDGNGVPYLHSLGRTRNNRRILRFFQSANHRYDFSHIGIPERVRRICFKTLPASLEYSSGQSDSSPFGTALWILFKDERGIIHSATDYELASIDDQLRFLRWALRHKEHLILKLVGTVVRVHDERKIVEALESLKPAASEQGHGLRTETQGLFGYAALMDVSTTVRVAVESTISAINHAEIDPTGLSCWAGSSKVTLTAGQPQVTTTYKNGQRPKIVLFDEQARRREKRYLARTRAQLALGRDRIDGLTRDISVRGLSLLIENPPPLTIGQQVRIGLVNFGKKTYNFDIRNIPYKVVDVEPGNQTRINLERVKDEHWDDVTAFFQEVISLNEAKLSVCVEDLITAAAAQLHENILSSHLLSIPVFIGLENSTPKIVHVAISEHTPELVDFFYFDRYELDLRALSGANLLGELGNKLTNFGNSDGAAAPWLELYMLKRIDRRTKQPYIETRGSWQFNSNKERMAFIQEALRSDQYRFFAANLVPLPKEALRQNLSTLDQMRELSRQHAQQCERELKQLCGRIELLDVTEEIRQFVSASQC